MTYSVTLEHGSDGSCLAWVHELPGCFVRAAGRDDALDRLPETIRSFLAWLREAGEEVEAGDEVDVAVVEEVESVVETSEDTEALVAADRRPLTPADWATVERWLIHSRREVQQAVSALGGQLERRPAATGRTVREELIHIAFVELMYAAWTFDLRSPNGLADFLAWTRDVAVTRMRFLADHDDGSVTSAEWAGAPRPEEWTARKAARRLIWHERLHAPSLR